MLLLGELKSNTVCKFIHTQTKKNSKIQPLANDKQNTHKKKLPSENRANYHNEVNGSYELPPPKKTQVWIPNVNPPHTQTHIHTQTERKTIIPPPQKNIYIEREIQQEEET